MKETDHKRRVVVTGLGVVSSLGIGWKPFWKNLIAGKSERIIGVYEGIVENFFKTEEEDAKL